MDEILDFYHGIEEYGHIFYLDPKLLDEPFKKILEGIKAIEDMMKESYEM
jgi:hypothetical protein